MQQILVNGEKIIPSKVLCIGRNFVEHIQELNNEVPSEMVVFNKPNSSISEQLFAEHLQETLHYEAELCFVVKNQQLAAVGIGLDLTKRTLQSTLKSKGLPWERAKAFDHSAVFSDFVAIKPEDIVNELSFELTIDSKLTQAGNIGLMINKPAEILNNISAYTSLYDGDIIMTGTPKGVGELESGMKIHGRVFIDDKELVSAHWMVV